MEQPPRWFMGFAMNATMNMYAKAYPMDGFGSWNVPWYICHGVNHGYFQAFYMAYTMGAHEILVCHGSTWFRVSTHGQLICAAMIENL